jgi:hypothetical protein
MKINYLLFACLLCSVIYGCQNLSQKSEEVTVKDTRPKEQIYYLNKVKADNEIYLYTSMATVKDSVKAAFDKYALDSLKKIQSWEMLVEGVDDTGLSSSVAEVTLDTYSTPVYNLRLVSPIKIDNTIDTIAVDNRADFTYTIPKNPTDDFLKKQIAIIKTLTYGDTVIVSGSLTHVEDGKITFAPLFDEQWNVDLLITDIKKKGQK